MKTIYLVTQGSYSDYGVVAAFSTKEKAEEYINYMSEAYKAFDSCFNEFNDIEEMDIDRPEEGWARIRICMDRDGNVDEDADVFDSSYDEEWDRLKFTMYIDSANVDLTCTIRGIDKERCIKVANEYRIQYIAAGLKWGCNDTLKWWLKGLKKNKSDE